MDMATDAIISKIEASRKELLDLGLRNPLLNYRALKSRGVDVVDDIPASVFDILVRKERRMSFLPRPDDDEDYELGQSEYDDDNPDVLARRHTDNRLQTNEPSDRLQSRLLNTYYTANTVIQEQGVNTLFIALGMVEWYESDTSDSVRRAPLVLIPVSLERSSVGAPFHVKYTGEELGANISFREKARTEFGVDVPDLHDNDEEGEEDVDLPAYFYKVERNIKGLNRWSVDKASIVLGFFSFSKLLMYRDLDSENWPAGTGPLESKTVHALFEAGFTEPEAEIGEEDHLDDHLRPEDTHHVVDADSSQALAISDVATGRNLVIQGPPGTGKSQTITNIIAAAMSQNKKVLFVSEKMAALEVVKRRLDGLQLGDACLELHSHKTTKRAVLDELRRAWELGRPDVTGMEDDFATLARVQSSLNEYAEAVNTPVGNTGVTPFRAYGELLHLQSLGAGNDSLPRPEIAGIDSWSRADFQEKHTVVANLQHSLGRVGSLKQHPFRGCRIQVVLPPDVDSLREKINAARQSLDALLLAVRSTLSKYKTKRLRFFLPPYRRAKKQLSTLCSGKLPDDIEQQIALINAIREKSQLRETSDIPDLSKRVTDAQKSHIGCLESVQDALDMDFRKRFGHPKGLAGLPLEEQQGTLVNWSSRIHEIQDIAVVNNALRDAEKEGLQAITKLVEEWPEASDHLIACLEQAWYERIVSHAFGERPALTGFDGSSYEAHREQFREMDTLVLGHNRARVAYAHWEGLPKHNGAGQLRVLRREFEKKRRHLPIRQLMERAGNAIQAIKPVFMMSPLSIATYLVPGSVSFDLVVFDEASQVRPVDALGALLRADQTVVVGDDRQLSPTSFFDVVTHAEGDDIDMHRWRKYHGLHDTPTRHLRKHIIEIVRVEGPVHGDVVARRIAAAAGVSRMSAKIRANLERVIKGVVGYKGNGIVRKGEFLWPADMKRPAVRDRSAVPQAKKIELISPEEIAEAVKMIVERSYGIDRADAAPEAGRILGFRRVSRDTRAKIDSVIEDLIGDGALNDDAGHLTLP